MTEFLTHQFLGNTVRNWLVAAAITLFVLVALFVLRAGLRRYVGSFVRRTQVRWDDAVGQVLERTHWLLLLAVAVLLGSQALNLVEKVREVIRNGVTVVLVIQGGIWVVCLIGFFAQEYRERRLREDPASATTVNAIAFLARLGTWATVILLILANLGIEITPLLAGLGVGGIAVALAVQTILKDLLASFSILLDKPFVIGDFLILGDLMGSVEHIGIKTTRLRSLSGEQLVFANADLLDSRIRNYGRMRERRVAFALGVTYQTPRAKLERIPALIRAAVESQSHTRFDRCHFKEYGSFALNFETVYYVGVPDYAVYMDIQQAINLRIHEAFEREAIEFAYPTQTLFVVPPGATGS
ncbi:MAG: mechanosensitive ion channel family protein [Verrucomicrobiales bacterium]|nr:mechanosensitive ion channel family protein [Verrucomicrobiales bacterium]MCP5528408.1 mechanosensitive ion channel family protein [Verrucomicrobiales bacterium]